MQLNLAALLRPSPALIVSLGAGIFILSLAVTAPARLAAGWLSQQIPILHLEGVSGTLWQGNAELAAVQVRGNWLSLGRLQWRLSPAALLLARVQLQVEATAADREISGTAIAGINGSILLRDALVLGKAPLLSPWLPKGMNAEGEISLRIRHLRWSGEIREVDASLGWQNSQLNIRGGSLAFGNLAADLARDEAGYLLAALEDFGGPLEVQGMLWYGGGAAGASGRIVPRQDAGALLRQRLRDIAGAPKPDGAFLLSLAIPPGSAGPQSLKPPEAYKSQAAESQTPETASGEAATESGTGAPSSAVAVPPEPSPNDNLQKE